jgi:hypothetical protein
MKTTTVTTYEAALDAINGRNYTLDGIHGTIRVDSWNGCVSIHHHPSKKGQGTEAYREMKRKLGDDWSTDLTNSERFGDVAHDLGIRFA